MGKLPLYFLKIIFKDMEDKTMVKAFVFFESSRIILIFIFNDYTFRKKSLSHISFIII